jgi:hypothetical protein
MNKQEEKEEGFLQIDPLERGLICMACLGLLIVKFLF